MPSAAAPSLTAFMATRREAPKQIKHFNREGGWKQKTKHTLDQSQLYVSTFNEK